MNIAYFNKYMHFDNLNSKQPADIAMKRFIKSFKNFNEKKLWTLEYLPRLYYGFFTTTIHAKLFEEVIFPVLLNGYKNKNISLMIWLAKVYQNCYQNKTIFKKLGRKTDLQIIEECYEMEPDNDEILELYMDYFMFSHMFIINDWNEMPSCGTNFMEKSECENLLKRTELMKKLDKHNAHLEYINNMAYNIKEYMKKFI